MGALSIQRPTRDILRVIPAFEISRTYSFDVYWKPRSLCKIGVTPGLALIAALIVFITKELLFVLLTTQLTISPIYLEIQLRNKESEEMWYFSQHSNKENFPDK